MSKKVLVADTEDWSRDVIHAAARGLQCEVIEASNGIQAIQKFKLYSPDIVFIDNLLPKIDGFQVVRSIKETELGKVTPVVLVSAIYRKGEDSRELLYLYSLAAFLEKPFAIPEVEALLKDFLSDVPEAVVEPFESAEEDRPCDYRPENRLEIRPVPVLLNELYRDRKSGVLYVSKGEVTKIVQFEHGMVTAARSNSVRDRIGRILVENGKLEKDALDAALKIQRQEGGKSRLGNILISLGLVSQEDLAFAVQNQAISILLGLFEWTDGLFHFLETERLKADFPLMKLNCLEIIFWGLRRLEGKQDFKKLLPSPKTVVRKTREAEAILEGAHLTYYEQQVLSLIDEKKTVGEIMTLGGMSHIDIHRVLYTLFTIGVLDEAGDRVSGEDGSPGRPGLSPGTLDASIPFRGKMEQVPLARILMKIYNARKTGILNLKNGGVSKYLVFEDGELQFAKSTEESDRIGNILLHSGLVSYEDCRRVAEEQQRRRKDRIGNLFIEDGVLTLEQLHWTIRFQIQQILMSVFSWETGDYLFVEGKIPSSEVITLEAPLPKVVMECLRKCPVTDYTSSFLPPEPAVLTCSCDTYQAVRALNLSISEVKVLFRLEHGCTVGELRKLHFLSQEEIDRMLYCFLTTGIVRVIDELPAPPERKRTGEVPAGQRADSDASAPVERPAEKREQEQDFLSVESFSWGGGEAEAAPHPKKEEPEKDALEDGTGIPKES
jgi:CheY-like chemotaxis protein